MKAALKICGMKYAENINDVAATEPDYLGFIFYAKSPRYFDGQIPNLPATIKKVGVFVGADLKYIEEKLQKYKLDVIQLHGDESPDFCKQVKVLKPLHTDNISKYETEAASPIEVKTPKLSEVEVLVSSEVEVPVSSEVEVPVLSEVEVPVLSEVEVPVLSEVEVWKVFSIRDHFDFDKLKPYEDHVDAFLFDTKGKEKGGNGYTFDWNVLNHYPSKKTIVLSGGIGIQEVNQLEQILKTDLPIKIIDVNSKFEEKPGFKNVQKLKEFNLKLSSK